MTRLDRAVAVVTGAGGGIGAATSRLLAQRGCHLALVDVDAAAVEDTAASIRRQGGTASAHVVDVADPYQVAALPAGILNHHERCNILVNNAGVTTAGRFEDESLEDLRWVVGINVWGVALCTRAFLPHLRAADDAHIVNISSMVGLLGLPQNAAYSLTKGAVRAFTEALRSELIDTHISVTAVFPGAIRTGIMSAARGSQAERLATLGGSGLAARALRPPTAVAEKVVRAIEKDRARVLVGPDAYAVDIAARLLPGRSGLVGRAVNRLTRPTA